MEWSSDLGWRSGGGTRFDSRLARAISPRFAFWLRNNPGGGYFGLGKKPCGSAHTHSPFLIHRRSVETQYSGENSLVDWLSDMVWRSGGGTRFDSRGAQVTFFGCVGEAFSLIFTHILACRVTLWTHFLVGSGSLSGRVGVTFS